VRHRRNRRGLRRRSAQDSKTGAKTLHLPPPALAERPRLDGNTHVIGGAKLGVW
jgi:hypothetical protein